MANFSIKPKSKSPIINKPVEKPKPNFELKPEPGEALSSSFVGNEFEPAQVSTPKLEPANDCLFRGTIRKGSQYGNMTFEASAELHQKHSRDFTCLDVILMEHHSGRHNSLCPHVGYTTSKACGCLPKDKN